MCVTHVDIQHTKEFLLLVCIYNFYFFVFIFKILYLGLHLGASHLVSLIRPLWVSSAAPLCSRCSHLDLLGQESSLGITAAHSSPLNSGRGGPQHGRDQPLSWKVFISNAQAGHQPPGTPKLQETRLKFSPAGLLRPHPLVLSTRLSLKKSLLCDL